jgi:uncharacterized protein YkwD
VDVSRRIVLAVATVAALALIATESAVGVSDSELVATADACPGSRSLRISAAKRREALMCLINYARASSGLPPVRSSGALSRVAHAKGRDVVACSDFSHTACGKRAFAYVESSGFPFRLVGENLFYSQRPVGTALDAFLAWLRSPPHRRLMFLPSFSDAGTAVFKLRSFSGTARVELWILELAQRR